MSGVNSKERRRTDVIQQLLAPPRLLEKVLSFSRKPLASIFLPREGRTWMYWSSFPDEILQRMTVKFLSFTLPHHARDSRDLSSISRRAFRKWQLEILDWLSFFNCFPEEKVMGYT